MNAVTAYGAERTEKKYNRKKTEGSIPLSALCAGERGRVASLRTVGTIRRRLLDLGLIEGTDVECLYVSPLGDPAAYLIRGAVIALRQSEAEFIEMI